MTRVRAQVDEAWIAAFRTMGVFFLGIGVYFLLTFLTAYPSPATGAFTIVYYVYWIIPVVFLVEGVLYFLAPDRFRAIQARRSLKRGRRLSREKIPDSRLSELMLHLRAMRQEITRIDRTNAVTTVVLVLLAIYSVLLGALTAGSVERLFSGAGANPSEGILVLVGGAVGIGILVYLLTRARVYLRNASRLAQGLRRCDDFLWGLEYRFFGRA